jgi:hypothetical protein
MPIRFGIYEDRLGLLQIGISRVLGFFFGILPNALWLLLHDRTMSSGILLLDILMQSILCTTCTSEIAWSRSPYQFAPSRLIILAAAGADHITTFTVSVLITFTITGSIKEQTTANPEQNFLTNASTALDPSTGVFRHDPQLQFLDNSDPPNIS